MSSDCPMCGERYQKSISLKNGGWAIEPIPEPADVFCAEWEDSSLHIYWHE